VPNGARDPEGRFAEHSFMAVYDALSREIHRVDENLVQEIKRIDSLRQADQISLQAALTAAKTAVDAALAAAEKAVAAALIAAKEAVNKAEVAQQRTNEGQNEFRAQLKDQAASFLPRAEYFLAQRSLEDKLDGIAKEFALLRSKVDVGPPSLSTLQSRLDANEGRRDGGSDTKTLVFALIGAGGIIMGVVLALAK